MYIEFIEEEFRRSSLSYGIVPYVLEPISSPFLIPNSNATADNNTETFGLFLWSDFNLNDLLHYLENSKEILDIPDEHKADYISALLIRYDDEVAFRRWKLNQVSIATGMIMGFCNANTIKLITLEPEQVIIEKSESKDLCMVFQISKNPKTSL